jgi:hypothetical protein
MEYSLLLSIEEVMPFKKCTRKNDVLACIGQGHVLKKIKEKYRASKFSFDPLGIWIMGHLWGSNGHLNATVFSWSN